MTARLEIAPRPPFRLGLTTWALRRRPANEIDRWDASTYRRAVSIDGDPVVLSVTQEGAANLPRLSVLLTGRPITPSDVPGARRTLDRLLGLSVDLSSFATIAAADPLLAPIAARMRGLRPPRFASVKRLGFSANKTRTIIEIARANVDTPLDYETVRELVVRWQPYAGVVYFHLLLDSLAHAGLVAAPEAGPMG